MMITSEFPKPTSTIPCTSKYWEPDENADYFLRCDNEGGKIKKGTVVNHITLSEVEGAGWRTYSYMVKETGERSQTHYEWLLVKDTKGNRFLFEREEETMVEIEKLESRLKYIREDYEV